MADHARQPQPGLTAARPASGRAWTSSSCCGGWSAAGGRFGRGGRPDREPARLGQELRLGFARARRGRADARRRGRAPARVSATLFGLLGPEGPMPLHLTRWVLDRLAQRWFAAGVEGATSDTTFLDFANLLQHRMLALYYRAWADQTPGGAGGARRRRPHARDARARWPAPAPTTLAPVKLGQAAALGHQVLGPERLTGLARAPRSACRSAIEEFVGTWSAIPRAAADPPRRAPTPRSAAARRSARASSRGRAASSSASARSALADYRDFLPGGARLATLRSALLHGIGETLDVDVRPVLRARRGPRRARSARRGSAAPPGSRRARDGGRRATCGSAPSSGSAAEGARAAA